MYFNVHFAKQLTDFWAILYMTKHNTSGSRSEEFHPASPRLVRTKTPDMSSCNALCVPHAAVSYYETLCVI
jgi:hypothetical protein